MEEQTLASTIIKKIAEILLIFMASVMIILVFWGVNKGFDITDEAYYLMGYRGGQEKLTNLSFFNLLEISKLFGWLNYLIQFRLLSIVLIIISSIIFSLGFYRFIQGIYSNKKCVFRLFTIIIWFIGVGFSFCTALPLTFSYNVFVQVALSSIAGLLLYILSFQNISQMKFRLWLTEATIGFLTAMVLLVKPTSAILIAIINVCIIGVLVSRNRTITLLNLAFLPFLGGLVLGLVVVLFGLNTFNEFKFAFTSGQVFTTPGYGLSLLLINAIKDICSFLIQIAWISWFYIVTFLLLLFQKSLILDRRFRSLITISISSWAIIFFAIYDFKDIYINSINGSLPISGFIFTGIFLFIVLIASQILERDKSVDNNPRIEIPAERKFLGVGLLIILPFVSAFGSSNPLSFQMWLHISPWCAILVILLQEFQNYRKFQSLVWGVFILFSLWLSFLWIGRYFYSPYRLVQNRLQQTELLSAQTGYLRHKSRYADKNFL